MKKWNFQDRFPLKSKKSIKNIEVVNKKYEEEHIEVSGDEASSQTLIKIV